MNDILSGLSSTNLMSAGLCFSFAFLVLWLAFSGGRMKLTLWHFGFFGLAGALIGSALQSYLKLWDWIELGATFTNLGASMFLIGFLSMFFVMIWNLVRSNGATLVR